MGIVTPTEFSALVSRNYMINGDMNVVQRGTSFPAAVSGQYPVDRFYYGKSGAMVHTLSQDTDVPTLTQASYSFEKSLLFTLTTPDTSIAAGDYCFLEQRIEGYNYVELAQKPFTLSFWVKATATGTYCCAIRNAGADRSYVAEYAISAANTWQKVEINVPASPTSGTWNYTNGAGLQVSWNLACGSTYQTVAGSWQIGNFLGTANQVNGVNTGATSFRVTGVMLNLGYDAAPFKLFGDTAAGELRACQRYLWRTVAGGSEYFANGFFDTTTAIVGIIKFPVTMRGTPGMSASAGTDLLIMRPGTSTASGTGAVSFSVINKETAVISATSGSASTQGFATNIGVVSSGYVQADAEI